MMGGMVAPVVKIYAVEDVKYVGEDALKRDIANLEAAMDAAGAEYAFMPSTAKISAKKMKFVKKYACIVNTREI